MKNKNLIIGGVILAGLVAYYFYNKNKGGVAASNAPASPIAPTMGGNLTDCKNIVTMPCLVAPCPKICADNVTTASSPTMGGIPKPYDNTANCEEQFKKYMSRVRLKSMTPEESKAYKENWIKNNCSLKM